MVMISDFTTTTLCLVLSRRSAEKKKKKLSQEFYQGINAENELFRSNVHSMPVH